MATHSPTKPPTRVPPGLIGVGILVLVVGFLVPRLGPTAPTTEAVPMAKPSESDQSPSLGATLGRLAIAMAVVCAVIVGLSWLVNKPDGALPGTMQILAGHQVDARTLIYLVRAGDRRLVIGTDHTGVKALVELPGPFPEPRGPVQTKPTETQITTLFARIPKQS